jgi:hypothetical protein
MRLPQRITRRGIQVTLGLLWLLDAGLQFQPQMFTRSFALNVIAPAGQGQPFFVSGPLSFEVHTLLFNPALFNAGFALVQLALAMLILWKRTARYGLIGSVVWGLSVWFWGEGLGGLASGQASLLMGAPGAALLYAVIALGVMPPKAASSQEDQRPAYWLMIAWAVVWVGGAIYQLLPGQNAIADLGSMISGNASGAPVWLAAVDTHVANVVTGFGAATSSSPGAQPAGMQMSGVHMTATQMAQMPIHQVSGLWFILLLAFLQALIGAAVFFPGFARRAAVVTGVLLAVVFWVVGQSLGAYFSGLATDPNTAPLLILLGATVLGCTQLDQKIPSFLAGVERALIGSSHST